MNIKKSLLWVAAATLFVGCKSAMDIASASFDKAPTTLTKEGKKYTDEALKPWPHESLTTGFPGINLKGAYELLKGMKPQTVIVGVVDSGVDIDHEDLKNVVWTNTKEIPGNGIDDDKNGYVDDIHGWNFLGNIGAENTEMTRIVKSGNKKNPDYAKAKEAYDKDCKEAKEDKEQYEQLLQVVTFSDGILKNLLKKDVYTLEDVEKAAKGNKYDAYTSEAIAFMRQILGKTGNSAELKKELEQGLEHFNTKLDRHLNTKFSPRKDILKDDENDFSKKYYGDNNVKGPVLKDALHGTHVAGIIGAERNNGKGMNGVANKVLIMAVRAVPDGDEYDKDVALAIRYAVDNGAKVINTSFGKGYSPHKEWVYDAIKYAASKDVLIVNAAGNDTKNIDLDKNATFPMDEINGKEFADNFLTVGALNYEYNDHLVAEFSNYGKRNVDVFAPGVKIYSTTPDNKYEFLQGTSMAAPEVAGLAALLRSYFPSLTAAQTKKVIMQSGVKVNMDVLIGDERGDAAPKKVPFADLSTTGTIVNARNAVILAAQLTKTKMKK
jgi:peptidase S8 and S53 subtilisin kexin sedolisin